MAARWKTSRWRALFLIGGVVAVWLALGMAWPARAGKNGDRDVEPLVSPKARRVMNDNAIVEFIAFGDSGSGSSNQYLLAARMLQLFEKHPYSLALVLGDNIYDNGDIVNHGQLKWKIPYFPLRERGVDFKPVLGNHDWLYENRRQQYRFYRMPSENYHFRKGNVAFFALDSEDIQPEEIRWLAKSLDQSKADWKIVYGHYPIISSGDHGGDPEMLKDVWPVLRDHGADLYISGHDHDYEHLRRQGVDFFVSGGGGRNLHGFPHLGRHANESIRRAQAYHFMHFVVNDDVLGFDVHSIDGRIIDSGRIRK